MRPSWKLALICIISLLLMGSLGLGAQNRPERKVAENPELTVDYVIGIEDVLSIFVWKEPDFSIRELVVRSDGKISLPLVNDIQAGGLTPKQLKEKITDRMKEYIETPNVTVTVLKSMSQSVSIVGQVNRPGSYTFIAPTTVLELLARAGGLTEFAKNKNIKIIRKTGEKIDQYSFNYYKVIKGEGMQQNITLKTGDIIMVP
jgi:polysaccharide biosynthesis/export protein